MTKDNCTPQDWLCEDCDAEEHKKASHKLGYETYEKIKDVIESIVFKDESSRLHQWDKQGITTDVLIKFAIMEQIFNRKFVYNDPEISEEMVEDMRDQYNFHLNKCVNHIDKKDKDLDLHSARTPKRSEVN